MHIVLATTSPLKINALLAALDECGLTADVEGVKAPSDVNEQPEGEETLRGAENRLTHARELAPDADLYVSVENGIYPDAGEYRDKAVLLAETRPGRRFVSESAAVTFPVAAVEEARARGFASTTVGSVMFEQGLVADQADPHKELTGLSRAELLKAAMVNLLRSAIDSGIPVARPCPPKGKMPLEPH